MKQSFRAKRMMRHHARMKRKSDLNLTALMDIFTILVFFLMVNSGEAQLLKDEDNLKMPVSVAKQEPKDTLVIQVTQTEIVVQGRAIVGVNDIKENDQGIIPNLDEELRYQASRRPEMTEEELLVGRAVTVQADKGLPYKVLRQIMATCALAEFRDISLAVNQGNAKSTKAGG
jgi:biopolymer transport protein ExbD